MKTLISKEYGKNHFSLHNMNVQGQLEFEWRHEKSVHYNRVCTSLHENHDFMKLWQEAIFSILDEYVIHHSLQMETREIFILLPSLYLPA